MRIGTRGSALALAQAGWVAGLIGEDAELVTVVTAGDRARDVGDKSRWTGTLETALLAGEVDLVVHSAKDVPGELAGGCAIAGAPARADARDALVGAESLAALPPGARVGTSALRRAALVRAEREDLEVVELRGNVDTRLLKLASGECDAIVLALAGLQRLGRAGAGDAHAGGAHAGDPQGGGTGAGGAGGDPTVVALSSFVPAPGQGILALEIRADDDDARAAAERVTDAGAWRCLAAERAVVRALGASCHTPVGAHATVQADGTLHLATFAGLPDGSEWIRDELVGSDPLALGAAVAQRMAAAGAESLLARAEAMVA